MTKDMDVETPAQIAAGAFARDLMVSNLGQMPYESEFGRLKLIARCFFCYAFACSGPASFADGWNKTGDEVLMYQ